MLDKGDTTTALHMLGIGYTSCIKINGKAILPPLITSEKRVELESYRQKAIELERRLKCQNDLKLFIQQIDSSNLKLENRALIKDNSQACSRTLEHLLSFGSDESHIDALNIQDISQQNQQKLPFKDCKTLVPSKKPNLTCNIFDVSEYSDNGVVIFNEYNKSESTENDKKLLSSKVELNLTDVTCVSDAYRKCEINTKENKNSSSSAETVSPLLFNPESNLKPKPRLLRSNSYTLESPSPVLLEHFKKQAEQDPDSSCGFEKYSGPKRRSLDLGSSSQCSTSFDDFVPKTNTASKSTLQKDTLKKDDHDNTLKGCDFTSVQNIDQAIQDLAHKHFGSNEQSPKKIVTRTHDLPSITLQVEETEAALHEVPENYAKDIMELLERHKKEQEIKLKSYAAFKQQHDQKLNSSTKNQDDSLTNKTEKENIATSSDEEVKSFSCNSQRVIGLINSPTDTLNHLNMSTPLLIDFESDSCDTERLINFEHNSSYSNSDPLHVLRGYDDYLRLSTNFENKSPNCSRELFPEKPDKIQRKLKEQWAATVLTAAAKGYLVRRLKRTERVRTLIQTIQDALLCAMSLHAENSESIHPPDVELHRRLIQQVSAACYEFYDVFFNQTTKEQMVLIALDRQRLQEKLKRPKSVSSLKLDSGRTTPKSQHSFSNMRQKKVLTPSFAA